MKKYVKVNVLHKLLMAILICSVLLSNGVLVTGAADNKTLSLSVSAINGASDPENIWYNMRFLFNDQVLSKSDFNTQAELQSTYPKIGDMIFLNGFSINEINRTCTDDIVEKPCVKIHWEANDALSSGKGLLRIDVRKENWGHCSHPDEANAFQVEFMAGIQCPSGNYLPQIKVNPRVGENDNILDYAVLQSQQSATKGSIEIIKLSGTQVPDDENYAFNIQFTEGVQVAAENTFNQWNNLYISEKVLINGQSIKDIKVNSVDESGEKFADAVDLHWFVDEDSSNGRLGLYIKKNIANDWKFEFDDQDTIEFLAGFRTPTNYELKTSVKFVYMSKYGVWEEVESEHKDIFAHSHIQGNKLICDIEGLVDGENSFSLSRNGFLLNGKTLPEDVNLQSVYSNGKRMFKMIIPIVRLATKGDNTVTVKKGVVFPNGYKAIRETKLALTPKLIVDKDYLVYDKLFDEQIMMSIQGLNQSVKFTCSDKDITDKVVYCEATETNKEGFVFDKSYLEELPLGIHFVKAQSGGGMTTILLHIKDSQPILTGGDQFKYYYNSGEEIQVYLDMQDAGYITSIVCNGEVLHGNTYSLNGLGLLISEKALANKPLGKYEFVVNTKHANVAFTVEILDGRPLIKKVVENNIKVETYDTDILSVMINGKELKLKQYVVEDNTLTIKERLKDGSIVTISTAYGTSEYVVNNNDDLYTLLIVASCTIVAVCIISFFIVNQTKKKGRSI